MTKKPLFIAFVVSIGGFLFRLDAGIISGVMSFVGPEFNLNDAKITDNPIQGEWVMELDWVKHEFRNN